MKEKFLLCEKCGNLVMPVYESGISIYCCNEPMKELIPNTTEAAFEKHIPIYNINNNMVNVKVSDVSHPMTEEHFIKWIIIKTTKGYYKKELAFNDSPEASFILNDNEKFISAYAYCNLHGLWKSK